MLVNARGRRRAWRISCAAGALAVAGALGAVASVPGTARASAPVSPIKHIVVLYLENHSFDSLFGFWCDDHPRRCPQGGMPATVHLSNGALPGYPANIHRCPPCPVCHDMTTGSPTRIDRKSVV